MPMATWCRRVKAGRMSGSEKAKIDAKANKVLKRSARKDVADAYEKMGK